ncbi:hypothetical protein MKJ04_06995 [Pontibacter sp. E15-1]|uniref:hypothetical protein n=1 Tax=Pontibacter sp. E15-1 TaxID=2919918 RepID=UPI001F4FE513|nr:hypothetical protein [Pontibacter sp. E15-1]MCJ8164589.1 hypothetical protein [Pontibacter sp. E15-1]
MVLFDSPILRLSYTPATDILIADLSNSYHFHAMEVQEALTMILNHVRHYDVKRLLMNSRNRVMVIDEMAYALLMTDFMKALLLTRLQKLARINTGIDSRESLVQYFDTQLVTTFTLKTFSCIETALEWLAAEV